MSEIDEGRIAVEGLVVRGGDESSIRIILDTVVVELALEDVLDVQMFDGPAELRADTAILARVVVVAGARLRGLGTSEPYRDLLWRHPLPYAMITRPDRAEFTVPEAYVTREREFLAANGLLEVLP